MEKEFKSKLKIREEILVLTTHDVKRWVVEGERVNNQKEKTAFFDEDDAIRYKNKRDEDDRNFFNKINNIPE